MDAIDLPVISMSVSMVSKEGVIYATGIPYKNDRVQEYGHL